MTRKAVLVFVLTVSVMAGAFARSAAETSPTPLVGADWLEERLDDEALRIIEIGRSFDDYRGAHVPGAVWLDLEAFRATEFVDNWDQLEVTGEVPGMLPPEDYLVAVLEDAGISRDRTVVVYDDRGSLWASYLFWILEYTGHERAHVLDGGLENWTAQGRPLSGEVPDVAPETYVADIRPELLATKAEVLGILDDDSSVIVDVRTEGEYSGEILRSARGGHIPGAVNVGWKTALKTEEDNVFRSAEELSGFYADLGITPEKTAVTHCQEGIRAAHTYLSLRQLGYEDVKVYDGSWFEWGNDPDVPVETGAGAGS